jgi:hypothetical protein
VGVRVGGCGVGAPGTSGQAVQWQGECGGGANGGGSISPLRAPALPPGCHPFAVSPVGLPSPSHPGDVSRDPGCPSGGVALGPHPVPLEPALASVLHRECRPCPRPPGSP